MPRRVLISDALSPAAVSIFKDRGVAVEFQPGLGKDNAKLAAIIGDFDGRLHNMATHIRVVGHPYQAVFPSRQARKLAERALQV